MADERIRFGIGLREADLRSGAREVEVVCIRPGLSRNGNYYGQECLGAALQLFEGARAYVDHAETAVRSVRDLAGVYRNPSIGPQGEVRATLRVSKAADWLWQLIAESVEEGSDLVGLSIDVSANTRQGEHNGTPCRLVERITRLHSCDVITRASAGGRFEKLAEADKQSWWDQWEPVNERAAELAAQAAAAGLAVRASQMPVEAGVVNPIQFGPSLAQRIDGGEVQVGGTYVSLRMPGPQGTPVAVGEPPATSAPVAPPPQITDSTQLREAEFARLVEELRAERVLLESERLLDRTLRECTLPAACRTRLERRFRGTAINEVTLAAAVEEERTVLAELSAAGLIRGMGFEKSVRVSMTEAERLQKAFDQLFDIYEGERVPELRSIREAYVVATGDLEIRRPRRFPSCSGPP